MVIQVSVYHSSHLKKTLVHIRFLIPTDMEVYSKGLELERFLIDPSVEVKLGKRHRGSINQDTHILNLINFFMVQRQYMLTLHCFPVW